MTYPRLKNIKKKAFEKEVQIRTFFVKTPIVTTEKYHCLLNIEVIAQNLLLKHNLTTDMEFFGSKAYFQTKISFCFYDILNGFWGRC